MGVARRFRSAAGGVMQKPFRYELQLRKDVSNAETLTNHHTSGHLQNRISGLAEGPCFLRFRDINEDEIGVKGYAEHAQIVCFYRYFPSISNVY